MNYNKAELCKDCKKPVNKVRERDRELYMMLDKLETLVNRTSMESRTDKGKIQRLILKIMEWLF